MVTRTEVSDDLEKLTGKVRKRLFCIRFYYS